MRAERKSIALCAAVAALLCGRGVSAQSGATGEPTGLPPKDGQTVLRIQRLFGPIRQDAASVALTLNGRAVRENRAKWEDVSGLVKPGANRLTLSTQNTGAVVTVSHAERAGKFRRIAQFMLRKKEAAAPRAFTFTLPGSAALDDPQGKAPRAGSADRQLVLRIQVTKPVTVYINGKKAGDFQNVMNLDIGNLARPGTNALRVVWLDAGTRGLVRAAYALPKNRFHDLATVRISGGESRGAGEESAIFACAEK